LRSNGSGGWLFQSGLGGADLRGLGLVQGGFLLSDDDGNVLSSLDAGATWQRVGSHVTSRALRSIALSPAGVYYIVGKGGTILASQ
jgi:photosystem II stability/assembly factor-like uncharacterized protein